MIHTNYYTAFPCFSIEKEGLELISSHIHVTKSSISPKDFDSLQDADLEESYTPKVNKKGKPVKSLPVEDYISSTHEKITPKIFRFSKDFPEDYIPSPRGKVTPTDFRFNTGIIYQGIANSDVMRANACASLRLQLWALNPSDSENKTFKRVCCVLVKPFAAVFDLVVNVALGVVKVAMTLFLISMKTIEKALDSNKNVGFSQILAFSLTNMFTHLRGPIFSSFWNLTYQCLGGFLINILGPEYDLYFRISPHFNWAYKVNRNEVILDVNRVRYLQNTCGWKNVSKKALQTLFPPWGEGVPPGLRIKYTNRRGSIDLTVRSRSR